MASNFMSLQELYAYRDVVGLNECEEIGEFGGATLCEVELELVVEKVTFRCENKLLPFCNKLKASPILMRSVFANAATSYWL